LYAGVERWTMPDTSFTVRTRPDAEVGSTLLVGTANPGLAGLTVVDYLVRSTGTEPNGHVRSLGLADVTPFTAGEPRHAFRLYTLPGADLTLLASEVFLPVDAAEAFVDALLSWTDAAGVDEVAVCHGVPYPHGPEQHRVFHVATRAFRERRLAAAGSEAAPVVPPMPGGFLDGVVGELMTAGLEETTAVGAFVTPTHPPGPDLDAALRFLDALEALYGLSVDPTGLRERAAEQRRYFAELANRVESLDRGKTSDYPEDRMFM
jgi:uncharacterized protein